tara:strand:+ start:619 stop:852 length:234 start_codon:yes stop_codon:yes gene_type:complete
MTRYIGTLFVNMAKENIFPCNRYFCKCVEYLDFSKSSDIRFYKNCMLTAERNAKYSRESIYKSENLIQGLSYNPFMK